MEPTVNTTKAPAASIQAVEVNIPTIPTNVVKPSVEKEAAVITPKVITQKTVTNEIKSVVTIQPEIISTNNTTTNRLVTLSAEEEQQLKRAARFGIVPSSVVASKIEATKKNARAERFGITESVETISKENKTITNVSNNNVVDPKITEQLRKRAERFGTIISPVLQLVEANKNIEEEQLKKKQRMERFGLTEDLTLSNNKNNKEANTGKRNK